MVGSLHPTPIATLPFLAPHSAVVPFCDGLYRHATAWDALRNDAATLAQDVTSLTEDMAQKSGITIEQVRERLRSVLSLTDVTRFPVPKNPQAVIFVGATVSVNVLSSFLKHDLPLLCLIYFSLARKFLDKSNSLSPSSTSAFWFPTITHILFLHSFKIDLLPASFAATHHLSCSFPIITHASL